MLAIGEGVAVLTPGAGSSTGTRVLVPWIGQIIAGIGAAALLAVVGVGGRAHETQTDPRMLTQQEAAS